MNKKDFNEIDATKKVLNYFFMIFLFIGTILSGIIVMLFNIQSKDFLERLKHEEKVNLKQQQSLVTSSLHSIVSDLLFLSNQNELQQLINNGDDDNSAVYKEWIAKEYLVLSREKHIYDQIRFLDETGMEVVRVNFNNGNPAIVKPEKLQSKGNRYYFTDAFALGPNKIFVSPLDLNVEKGKIEQPLKPMIRFAIPVFDNKNQKRGIILLNYLADNLIDSLKMASKTSRGSIMLVNSDSYWLCSPEIEDEWGFMMKDRKEKKFSNIYSPAWSKILPSQATQILDKNGLFTSATVYPLRDSLRGNVNDTLVLNESDISSNYFWKVISHIPQTALVDGTAKHSGNAFILAALLFILASFPSWIIAKFVVKRNMHTIRQQQRADKLEALVKARTLELDAANKDLKAANILAEKAQLAAEGSNKAKSDFLMNMGHELRTPLNGAIAAAELISMVASDEELEELQTIIKNSGYSLLKTIEQILEYTKSKDGDLKLEDLPFRLDKALTKISREFFYKGQNIGIKNTIKITSENIPNKLIGDEDRIIEILDHLLLNAAKFTTNPPESALAIAALETSKDSTVLQFSLTDNGIGIAQENFESIFEPFSQADTSSSREYDGVGVGLSICRQFVEIMGGAISVESEPGSGSTFIFTLHLKRQEPDEAFNFELIKADETAPDSEAETESLAEPELDKVSPVINNLLKAFSESDPQGIKTYLEEIRIFNLPYRSKLLQSVDNYEYDEAEAILKEIAATIGLKIQ